MRKIFLIIGSLFAMAAPVGAETEFNFYLGTQSAPHSTVKGEANGTSFDFGAEWEGRSFENPVYYGFRATFWQSDTFGWGVELNHAKVYADDDTLEDSGFVDLEFTDGLNLITVNAFKRWKNPESPWTPYIGAGAGISLPHVDVDIGGSNTFEYQLTGPAVVWMGGVKYAFNETWGMFGEYKGSYSVNRADLEGGGELETNIVTNALNIGVSYSY